MTEQKKTYPPLPPYKGAIFLREGNDDAKCIAHWNDIHDHVDMLSLHAIPGQTALILHTNTIYAWRDNLWCELVDESTHVRECIKRGNFNVRGQNYIDIPDRSKEIGIEPGKGDRRDWTLGNWIDHLGGRVNDRGYLEFGSVYAFDMMLRQMIRADFKGKEDKIRVTIDGGDDEMKVTIASLMIAAIDGDFCKIGDNLKEVLDRVNERGTNLDQIMAVSQRAAQAEITIDVLPRLR